nr:MAG TPA: hypothetical protein [Caudoviricetes sp.]
MLIFLDFLFFCCIFAPCKSNFYRCETQQTTNKKT